MNRNRQYFEDAEAEVQNEFFSASGDWDDYEEFDEDYDDEDFVDDDFSDYADDEYEMAAGRAAQLPTSQPYVISIENTSSSNVSNVIVCGAYANVSGATNFGNAAAVSITMQATNVTYQEFLNQTMTQPFVVGEIYLQSANTSQVIQTFTIRHQDSNGNLADKPMFPRRDPYQFQTDGLVHKFRHRIDGYTRYTIGTLLANATLLMHVFPEEKINLGRAVGGAKARKAYGNPKIVKPTVQIAVPARRRVPRQMRRIGK